jgi:glycosyltransferase family protein
MKNIYIFGAGKSSEVVESHLLPEAVNLKGYLDNNKGKQLTGFKGLPVIDPSNVNVLLYDYIIIGSVHYVSIMAQLQALGVESSRIIAFFSEDYIGKPEYGELINNTGWWQTVLRHKITVELEKQDKKINAILYNLEYEIADKLRQNHYRFFIIKSGEEAIDKIIKERCSISRFGDGEFEIIAGRARPIFQQPDTELADRLKEVLNSNLPNHILAIADNYGSLDKFDDAAAMAIREYMSPEVRERHVKLLNYNRTYYDAYLTRPYILYKDKESAGERFQHLMKIWENREVVIIEGEKTRMGIGNDLFHKAGSVRRIIAPSENAFSRYNSILQVALNSNKNVLFLIALGPTATVLAYDLAAQGFQAVDIGHVDVEYEWYRNKDMEKTNLKFKYVSDITNGNLVDDIVDEEYNSQIIAKIL